MMVKMGSSSERMILAVARIMRYRMDQSERKLRVLHEDLLKARSDYESLKIDESAWHQRKLDWEHKIYGTSHMLGRSEEFRRTGGEIVKQMDVHIAKVTQRRRLAESSLQLAEDKCRAQRMAILRESKRRDALMARANEMSRKRIIQAEED